jgi:hypothetical protein
MMVVEGHSVGPYSEGSTMQILRKAAIVLASATLTVGIAGATAPAQADTSWGCGGFCLLGR